MFFLAAVVVVVIVFVVVFIESLAVVVVLFVVMVAFWGQDREKCPNCLQYQQSGFLSSTMTVIVVSLYDMMWGIVLNPPLSSIIVNKKSPYAVPCADLIFI